MVDRVFTYFGLFGRNLWILALGWFVGAVGFAVSIPFLSIYFHNELGMSTTQIGLFFGAMAIVRSFFQAAGGEMSDRVGRAGLLVYSQAGRAGTFLCIGLAIHYDWGFWPIAAFVTLGSIFGAIFMPAINALVSDILPKEKRLDGYALTRSAGNFGWAVGPALGGFLAQSSYAILFYISGVIMFGSAIIFWRYFVAPPLVENREAFRFADLAAVRHDKNLARHCLLIFFLYLVVAQLIAPFSVFTVSMVGLSETSLGWLFTINGLMVTALQIPVTRLLAKYKFTTQLAIGSLLYFIGYGSLGFFDTFGLFVVITMIVTSGEIVMSPPALTLTSRLAPDGRMGRYMGVFGFFTTAGWSLGPLYGGFFLDHFSTQPAVAWLLIGALAIIPAYGYLRYGRHLPEEVNRPG